MTVLRQATRNVVALANRTTMNRNAVVMRKNVKPTTTTAIRTMGGSSGDHGDHHHEHVSNTMYCAL